MITSSYRIFREDDGDHVFHKVFHAEDGLIIGCTANTVGPKGRTLEELARDIEALRTAFYLPVLTRKDIL